jgi:hypothetical protein
VAETFSLIASHVSQELSLRESSYSCASVQLNSELRLSGGKTCAKDSRYQDRRKGVFVTTVAELLSRMIESVVR